ncbi:MAG: hypothetical protein WCZ65_03990 [Lysobacteraceae bacterium]
MHGLARRSWLALILLALAACSAAPAPEAPVDEPVDEVVYACTQDSDCAVKNVGNCCGYYPACVNVDSPTFPERVRAQCEAEGVSGVCGYPEIVGCRCVAQRCEGVTGQAAADPR